MTDENVDLDALIGSWRAALEAAQNALRAGSHDLTREQLRIHTQRLADERGRTVRLLDAVARERQAKRFLVRLVAAPWEAKRLLGLPTDAVACVFNVDGVLVPSAEIHAGAWQATLDEFVARWIERTGVPIASFSVGVDYPHHVHGKARTDAVRAFLASRGISIPEGAPDDPPGADTVNGLANRKQQELTSRLEQGRVKPYEGSRLYLELAHDANVLCAVVSGSTNTEALLERARLAPLVDECVDGNVARAEGLRRKPAPDMLLAACERLGVEPVRTVVFETTVEGVDAGRAGAFELVVAIDRDGNAGALHARGADLVATDLGAVLERQLGAAR